MVNGEHNNKSEFSAHTILEERSSTVMSSVGILLFRRINSYIDVCDVTSTTALENKNVCLFRRHAYIYKYG